MAAVRPGSAMSTGEDRPLRYPTIATATAADHRIRGPPMAAEQPEPLETLLISLIGYGTEGDRRWSLEAGLNTPLVKPPTVKTWSSFPQFGALIAGSCVQATV